MKLSEWKKLSKEQAAQAVKEMETEQLLKLKKAIRNSERRKEMNSVMKDSGLYSYRNDSGKVCWE